MHAMGRRSHGPYGIGIRGLCATSVVLVTQRTYLVLVIKASRTSQKKINRHNNQRI